MKNRLFIVILIGACAVMYGCGNDAKEKKVMEPEEVAEQFCRAVAGGEFEQAWALCDTVAMKDYLNEQEASWNMLEQVDSSAFSIASEMLRNIDFTVEDIVKEGEERHLFTSIGFNGSNKGKLIILKKEEGEWKVSQIADRS